jgi:hypothetical protein
MTPEVRRRFGFAPKASPERNCHLWAQGCQQLTPPAKFAAEHSTTDLGEDRILGQPEVA